MSLKLIKTAQIITSTSKHDLEVLGVLSEAVGKPLHELNLSESYTWTPEDYEQMLDLIRAYGEENGMNVNKFAVFSNIAGAALEDDSKAPLDPKLQGLLIKKLWNDFKAAKQLAKINKLGQAAEEEEMLKANLRRLAQGREEEELGYDEHRGEQVTTGEQDDDAYWADQEDQPLPRYEPLPHPLDREEEEYGQGVQSPNYQDDKTGSSITGAERFGHLAGYLNKHAGANDIFTYGSGAENEEQGARHQDVRKLNPTLDRQLFTQNDAETIANRARLHAAQENEERAKAAELAAKNNAVWGKRVSGSPEQAAHRAAQGGGYQTRSEYLSAIKRANKRNEENEEESPMSAKPDTETAEKTPKTPEEIAHQILTAPRELMRDATKSIKSDGAKAWDEHELPKNPHPIKSAAHKHWLDGMRKAAIASLGLEPKPTEPAKKKR